ncbi:MAG: hypothetical protein HZB38_14145 [Planctomycetes bacterium]|nr:hypothetical protein [Planctomycetota bacterium]
MIVAKRPAAGSLRVDVDGDWVAYSEGPVAVTAGSAEPRKLWIYASTIKENGSGNLELTAYDENNIAFSLGSAIRPDIVGSDAEIVLDISGAPCDGLRGLDRFSEYSSFSSSFGQKPYYRVVCVAALPFRSLPDRWFGLEAATTIVWDEPDPDALSNEQLTALKQWVRAGGKLVLGIGPSWLKLQKSPLAEILPLKGDAQPVSTAYLQFFAGRYVAGGKPSAFKTPLSVIAAEPTADAVVTLRDRTAENLDVNLVAMRWEGSGRVMTVASRISDLAAVNPQLRFYRELVDVTTLPETFRKNEAEHAYAIRTAGLHDEIVRPTEFGRVASIRLLLAYTFVIAYGLLATFGSWMWLSRHKQTTLSWTVFAGFAVAASFLGIAAVSIFGGTDAVAGVSVVDLHSGATDARARVWFGFKSWVRQSVNISLPGPNNYLRPMGTGPGTVSAYATPARYTAQPERAMLLGTPMRATLKQFEGYWEGKLDGPVRANLTADRSSGRITPESWISSDLSADIRGGYLLYIDPRVKSLDGVPARAAVLENTSFRGAKLRERDVAKDLAAAGLNVLVVRIGPLKTAERMTSIGRTWYRDFDTLYERWIAAGEKPKDEPLLPTLWQEQNTQWLPSIAPTLGVLGGREDANTAALLMASTRSLYLHNSGGDFDAVGVAVTSEGVTELDVTHWLTRGQAMLLLSSDEPGPAKLNIGDSPRKAREGRTLYRVRVPINYTGAAPGGS